jgi:hypothetical protein
MSAHAELAAWLRLTLVPGIGGETQRQLLKVFGGPAAVFAASATALRGSLGGGLAERLLTHECAAEIEAALAWAAQPGNRILTLADAEYPQALLTAADPPVLLYAKGDLALLNRPAFAIVGSRNATKQGEANATAFAATLADAGLAIVSGLAAGIDAAAHRGALQADGPTVAVIGTGIDRIYPASNEALAREIASHGVILSEFPLGTPRLPGGRGRPAQRLADHRPARRRSRPRGLRDPRLDPLAPVEGLPCPHQARSETGRIGAGHIGRAQVGGSCLTDRAQRANQAPRPGAGARGWGATLGRRRRRRGGRSPPRCYRL